MYGLIGKKLDYSFSAKFFNEKFAREGIDESYKLLPIPSIHLLPDLLQRFPDLKGLNVTIPYKQDIIKYLSSFSEEAKEIGAVNVVKIKRNNGEIILEGFNSDCIGFRNSLAPLLNPDIKKALVLGTGGASKAVEYALKNLGIEPTFVSRYPKENQMAYQDIDRKIINENHLIVNTTPLGTFPNLEECPAIPYQYLTSCHLCYDLVYNPAITEFMKRSEAQGAKVKNGFEMLEGQALASWDIWNS